MNQKDPSDSVIPAKAPRRKHPWGAGIQLCTTGFRVKPGMTWLSIVFNMTAY